MDGGRLLFIILEIVRGKPLPPEKEGFVHFIGFAILMGLMVFVLFKDLLKFF
ncbi:MAG: site-2 protease family protein [Bacillota bacterium]|nr:site-2 protease family protein [Bacillota bacterium]